MPSLVEWTSLVMVVLAFVLCGAALWLSYRMATRAMGNAERMAMEVRLIVAARTDTQAGRIQSATERDKIGRASDQLKKYLEIRESERQKQNRHARVEPRAPVYKRHLSPIDGDLPKPKKEVSDGGDTGTPVKQTGQG